MASLELPTSKISEFRRMVVRAVIDRAGKLWLVRNQGSQTLNRILSNWPNVDYVVVSYSGKFRVLDMGSVVLDSDAYAYCTRFSTHDDEDAAVMAAVLKTGQKV